MSTLYLTGTGWRGVLAGALAMVVLAASAVPALAEEPQPGAAEISAASPPPVATEKKVDTGDNAWMLTSSALVLMMTGPGLAMFYCGLVRKQNVLSVIMQCVFLMGLMSVIWALWGYAFSFGDGKWLGDGGKYVCLEGVGPTVENGQVVFPQSAAGNFSVLTHMIYQGMFMVITPALICGAFAERMKFSTMVVFMILWATLVYCPLAHAVWGGGVLAYGSDHAKGFAQGGALDFAGGTVVHISSGVSALICALVLGKRLGYGTQPMPPHNLTYTAFGAAMLWVGWFGFNAGSALGAGDLASLAFCTTHLAAAAACLTWAGLEWIVRGKPTVLGACSGAVAGLVCVTPAAGFVLPMPALVLGVAASVVCFLACTWLKSKFRYDDSLDAFGIHGVGGTLGAILTGVFATHATGATAALDKTIDPAAPLGLYEGATKLLGAQLVAVAVTWALAIVATFIILKVLDALMGLRVSQAEEIQGLDLSQHGEEGYIFI